MKTDEDDEDRNPEDHSEFSNETQQHHILYHPPKNIKLQKPDIVLQIFNVVQKESNLEPAMSAITHLQNTYKIEIDLFYDPKTPFSNSYTIFDLRKKSGIVQNISQLKRLLEITKLKQQGGGPRSIAKRTCYDYKNNIATQRQYYKCRTNSNLHVCTLLTGLAVWF